MIIQTLTITRKGANKMKKILGIILFTVMITACSTQDVSNSNGAYKDGTYKAAGDKWDFGSEEATVIIKDSKIEEIALQRIDTEGNEVDYKAYHEMGGPDLSKARKEVSEAMVKKQTFEVDSISGASISSGNWKIAVERALEKATK